MTSVEVLVRVSGHPVDPAFRQTLVQYARRRVPAADVEDVVQEALCDALRPDAPATRTEMLRFALTILRRRIVDSYRARRRSPLVAGCVDYEGSHDPRPALEARDGLRRLELAPGTLDLILADERDDSADVARADLTAGAVRQRISRERKRLRIWWAAAATFVTLALIASMAGLGRPDIVREPGHTPLASLAQASGRYRIESIAPSPGSGAETVALARAFEGAELRVDGSSVTLHGRPLLVLGALHDGSVEAVTSNGEPLRVTIRERDGDRLTLESWSGPWQGRATLVRAR